MYCTRRCKKVKNQNLTNCGSLACGIILSDAPLFPRPGKTKPQVAVPVVFGGVVAAIGTTCAGGGEPRTATGKLSGWRRCHSRFGGPLLFFFFD